MALRQRTRLHAQHADLDHKRPVDHDDERAHQQHAHHHDRNAMPDYDRSAHVAIRDLAHYGANDTYYESHDRALDLGSLTRAIADRLDERYVRADDLADIIAQRIDAALDTRTIDRARADDDEHDEQADDGSVTLTSEQADVLRAVIEDRASNARFDSARRYLETVWFDSPGLADALGLD